MKKEERKKLVITVIVLILVLIIFFGYQIISRYKSSNSNAIQGSISTSEIAQNEASINSSSWEAADAEYESAMQNNVVINDVNGVLSQKGFMSSQNHILLTESLGTFLHNNGYNCDTVTVIDGSSSQDGSRSQFAVSLDGYDDLYVLVIAYNKTYSFNFYLSDGVIILVDDSGAYTGMSLEDIE